MVGLKKIVIWQYITSAISVVSFAISLLALVSVYQIKKKAGDNKNKISYGKELATDVVIVDERNGNEIALYANESNDAIGNLLKSKDEKKHNKENVAKKNEKKVMPSNERANNIEKNQSAIRQGKNTNVVPISREKENNNIKIDVKKKVIENHISKNKITGDFVVQIGAFKDRGKSLQQCQQVKNIIDNKSCDIATTNGLVFRVIIYPFKNEEEAKIFAKNLSLKTKLSCLVKKNA